MQKLLDGLRQFMSTVQEDERELFSRLSHGQNPEVMFITCSDSRISPHLMTQAKPGDLFVLRNAGNIVPPYGAVDGGEAATLEYAISVLGVRHVVVCGHSDCGAMKGLLAPESCSHLPLVRRWLGYAEPARRIVLQRRDGEGAPEQRLDVLIEVNVLAQLANLRTHPAVAAHLVTGELELHGWTYDIASGRVSAFDSQAGVFVNVLEASTARQVVGVSSLVA